MGSLHQERIATALAFLSALLVLTLSLLVPAPAGAQERSLFRGRVSVTGGYVASKDQQARYGFDLPALSADVRAGVALHDAVSIEGRLGGTAFLSSDQPAGALLDLSVGAEAGVDVGVGRAYLAVHAGAGLTGSLVRPVLHISAGFDVHATPEIALGPIFEYSHVFQDDGTTAEMWYSDDAIYVSVGLSLRISPMMGAPPPPPEPEPEPEPELAPLGELPHIELTTPPVEEAEIMAMIDQAVRPEPRELVVPVLFAFDSTDLITCSVASLHALREYLERHPEVGLLEIEGHADGSGTEEYNRQLSHRRAETIRDWLIVHGVAPERLTTAAQGEAAPVEANDEEDGRSQNRRARFRVLEEQSR